LVKEYKTQRVVRALDMISLAVQKGEIFGLLGPNGAGKTTLVKILVTLLDADGGRATVGGYDVSAEEEKVREIIGYAGQDSERSAFFRLTAKENLLYYAYVSCRHPGKVVLEKIDELAEVLGFEDKLGKYFITLSGGEKQMVILMRALLHSPRVCFLDEPTKSLDPLAARRVREYLREYVHRDKGTLLVTTHNMTEAETMCDRIGLIDRGHIVFVGTPEEFKKVVPPKDVVEVGAELDRAVTSKICSLHGVLSVAIGPVSKIFCRDALDVLPEITSLIRDARIRGYVKIAEPNLEDAFEHFIRGPRYKQDN